MGYASLVGTPYEKAHCWDIVKSFYQIEFGIELNHQAINPPQQRKDIEHLIWSHKHEYIEVTGSELQFGDILLIRIRAIESHIGVYVGEGKILHSLDGVGCVVDLMTRWHHNVSGVYRVKGLKK